MRISTKTISLMAGSLFVVGLAAGTNTGCGSSSSSPNLTGICNQYCAKCNGASADLTTAALCANCAAFSSSMSSCSNQSAITQAAQACANMSTCTASESCFETDIPDCQGGGGSSGSATGGTGGAQTGATGGAGGHTTTTTGAAGNGGTADCSVCAKAAACCTAEAALTNQPATSCSMFSVAMCNAGSTTSTAQNCQTIVQGGAALSLPACQ
ncbi:MAG: hypothetical protein ACJ8F1_05930 [Polyangia bacterium]